MIDIHSHILPGVDDGAANADESLQMLRAAKAIGITHIVATPHVRRRKPDLERIAKAIQTVRDMAGFLGIQVIQGYEVNLQAIDTDNMRDMRRYCFEGTDNLLLEMPDDLWPGNWEQILYRLQTMGLEIIIAHPERYKPLQRDFERVKTLVDMDCYLQVTAKSVLNSLWMKPDQKLARQIIENELLSYVASDAHSHTGYDSFNRAVSKLAKIGFRYSSMANIENRVSVYKASQTTL